ncbi:hypothetical protein MAR_013084 [Mya arenaria]|uniref:Uncharacterized protein n=1 Tax=Mya arenaria TaxID=6604 RepID=A0ABY7FYY8_MYAAR|nr:hypothetical protein MAR_013084 [Mya arenaria]
MTPVFVNSFELVDIFGQILHLSVWGITLVEEYSTYRLVEEYSTYRLVEEYSTYRLVEEYSTYRLVEEYSTYRLVEEYSTYRLVEEYSTYRLVEEYSTSNSSSSSNSNSNSNSNSSSSSSSSSNSSSSISSISSSSSTLVLCSGQNDGFNTWLHDDQLMVSNYFTRTEHTFEECKTQCPTGADLLDLSNPSIISEKGDQTGRKLGKWLSTNSPSAWLIRGATALNITAQSGVLC